jgi:hypothetical protein
MEVTYFESEGKQNTETLLKLARDYADKNNIKNIVVASTYGDTAEKASEVFRGKNLVIVSHEAGFKEEDKQQFDEKIREKLASRGVKILTTVHGFGGINRLSDYSTGSIIANTLRMFSQGVKVAVEVSIMAADAGLVGVKEDIVAIAGTGSGADTAIVVRPSNSKNVFNLRVKKILAKPL